MVHVHPSQSFREGRLGTYSYILAPVQPELIWDLVVNRLADRAPGITRRILLKLNYGEGKSLRFLKIPQIRKYFVY